MLYILYPFVTRLLTLARMYIRAITASGSLRALTADR
jgi:hypothetical protein